MGRRRTGRSRTASPSTSGETQEKGREVVREEGGMYTLTTPMCGRGLTV